MNQIAGLLPVNNILLDLDIANKKRVFEQVGLLFENNHGIGRNIVYDSLFAREKLGSTGLGQGIAIPHGRIKGIPEAIGAFVRTKTPIPFDSPDGRGVTTIFVCWSPSRRPTAICRSCRNSRRCSATSHSAS
jgi:PTS system nitrogen regulatory IIA component